MSKECLYEDQKIRIYEAKDKFKIGILHYTKRGLRFTLYQKLYLTEEEAMNKAKEIIDNNLESCKWTKKPLT